MKGNELVFFVNGSKVVDLHPSPQESLLQYLRKKLRLTGSKLGCGEGGCGSCTVMVSKYNRHTDTISHYSVNACLAPVCSLHGLAVTTVEGIGSTKTRLHPVQERLAKAHGTQCGFCTPGIVMSMYTLLRNNPHPTRKQIEDTFDGNLCRCTGYRSILQGFYSFAKDVGSMGENCCLSKSKNMSRLDKKCCCSTSEGSDAIRIGCSPIFKENAYVQSQEPIFPPELKLNMEKYETTLQFRNDSCAWYRPVSLEELCHLKTLYPEAKLVVGTTEIGIEARSKNYPVLIAATHVPELKVVELTDKGVSFGASVTLSTVHDVLVNAVDSMKEHKIRGFKAFIEMLQRFAGHQIRNVASIGGNIVTASPISDLNPLLVAVGATLTVGSKGKSPRRVKMDQDFFKSYRKTSLCPEDIVLTVFIPCSSPNEYFSSFKQAHRKDDDITIVNAGMKVAFKEETSIVEDITLVYGGMAPTIMVAKKTIDALKDRVWNEELLEKAITCIQSDLPLAFGSPGGMEEYRKTLTISFFFKFYMEVKEKLNRDSELNTDGKGAIGDIVREVSDGAQLFQAVGQEQDPDDATGRPLMHTSSLQQATGEAIYVDDLPNVEGELYAGLVLSTKAHARIVSVDASAALSMPGIVDYVDNKDIAGKKTLNVKDGIHEIFASEKVMYQGQVIGCVVGKTEVEVAHAVKKVAIEYEELKAIISIEEAIEAQSFFDHEVTKQCGDVEAGFRECDHVIDGEIRIGAQKHFYMEPIAAVARPTNEDGGIEIISTTQFPSGVQHQVAETLGIQANKVVSRVKRLGGAFGGKQINTTMVVLPVAIAAAKLNRPVRCALDRETDMIMTGGRHPFLMKYKVGFTKTGLIKCLDQELYTNGGTRLQGSDVLMRQVIYNSDGTYRIPNVRLRGRVCKTNIQTPTAMRAFGVPQALLTVETWMNTIAEVLNKAQDEVRQLNLYHAGHLTFYGQEILDDNISKLWEQCIIQSKYKDRKNQVVEFNKKNRWKKRGISVIPTKYQIGYAASQRYLNQACALVTAYNDGSVLVAHCGVEMGQGLHTKMIQVASRALEIPVSKIYTSDTCSDKIHVTCPTAASCGSDLNGGAVKNACELLARRLQPYKNANSNATFKDWVNAAYEDRVHLSAAGYFRTEGMEYDEDKNKGEYCNYFVWGVACSEVEIDCLTGDHQILQTDIVMDVGKSLNPAVDIGQIEGGFVQGCGLYLMEEWKTKPSGMVLTRGPGTYKIPGFKDIPVKLNVTLLKDSENPKAVYSSKGIGEPPLLLASSAYFAVKDAIKSAREVAGHSRIFRLDSPATPERIRMACQDQFTQKSVVSKEPTTTPWYIQI